MDRFTIRRRATGKIINNFKFGKDQKWATSITWGCSTHYCPAWAKTEITICALLQREVGPNRDAPTELNLELQGPRASVKRKAIAQRNVKPAKVICPVASKPPSLDVEDAKRLYKLWQNQQLKLLPSLPGSRAETFRALESLEYTLPCTSWQDCGDSQKLITSNFFQELCEHILMELLKCVRNSCFLHHPRICERSIRPLPSVFCVISKKRPYKRKVDVLFVICTKELAVQPTFIHLPLEVAAIKTHSKLLPRVRATCMLF